MVVKQQVLGVARVFFRREHDEHMAGGIEHTAQGQHVLLESKGLHRVAPEW
jgi:hypothetical protein